MLTGVGMTKTNKKTMDLGFRLDDSCSYDVLQSYIIMSNTSSNSRNLWSFFYVCSTCTIFRSHHDLHLSRLCKGQGYMYDLHAFDAPYMVSYWCLIVTLCPDSAPLRDIMLQNMRDLDFDISRSPRVKCDSAIGIPVYCFLVVSNNIVT